MITFRYVLSVHAPRSRRTAERLFRQSVADREHRTPKFKAPPERPAESTNHPVKIPPPHLAGRVTITVRDRGPQPPPFPAGRSPSLEQISSPTTKEVPVKAVKKNPVTAMPVQAVPVKAPPEKHMIPTEDRVWNYNSCVDVVLEVSTDFTADDLIATTFTPSSWTCWSSYLENV